MHSVEILLVVATLLTATQASWPQIGGNAAHTGEWPGKGPQACSVQTWTTIAVDSDTNPVLVDQSDGDALYFGQWSAGQTFFSYALPTNGNASLRWNVNHSAIGVVAGSTALVDAARRRVYTISDSLGYGFFCFDADSGAPLWPAYLPTADSTCAPTLGGANMSLVFVGDWMANFYAVDADSGKLVWQFVDAAPPDAPPQQMPFNFNSAPVSRPDGSVVYAASLRSVFAFASASGAVLWNATTSAASGLTMPSTQLIYDAANDAVVLTAQSNVQFGGDSPFGYQQFWLRGVYALDAATGALRWQFLPANQTATGQALALSGQLGVLFVATGAAAYGDSGSYLYALSAANGTLLWRSDLPDIATSLVVDAAGTVYVSSANILSAFDAYSGAALWSWTHTATFNNLLAFTSTGALWLTDSSSQFAIGPSSFPCS